MPKQYTSQQKEPAVYGADGVGYTGSNVADPTAAMQQAMAPVEEVNRGGQASDSTLTAGNHANKLEADTPLRVGRVLISLPYIHCYKVQISGRAAPCVATALTHSSMMPTGVRSIEVIPPNSQVLIWQPKAGKLAYIVGVIPVATMSDKFNISDHLQAGGNSGPKKREAYRNIPKSVSDNMGWVPQSSGRPMDGTQGEWGRLSETGIGILIDSFQAYLRVNEVCGLWLNYFDNYTKLAGLSLNLMSYCENIMQTYDEGENFSLAGHCTFPWEATGMYAPGQKFSQNNPKDQVQLDPEFPFAEEDVEDLSQTPVYRLTDYTGYMGQGWNRTLMKPAGESGKRLMTDTDDDVGLFNEFLALDGAYSIRSKKSIFIAKYPLISSPRRVRAPEDAKGDDLQEDNDYKFSGIFGDGDDHLSREWDDDDVDDLKNLMKPAGILDMVAHHYNWKSTFPFYYHKKDYRYPVEADLDQGDVKFYVGNMYEAYVDIGGASSLQISQAYGSVKYYNTASFITLTDDGSVLIADGYGSQITMAGGQIRLESGGDVMLMSNSRVITLARESIVRAKGSVDISSSDMDVRIRAKNNFQLMGGSLLLESNGSTNFGSQQNYEDKIGEEVFATGITLLAKGSSINGISSDAYWRTGISEQGTSQGFGDFIIDADNGNGRTITYAAQSSFFAKDFVGIWHDPSGRDNASEGIQKGHFFSNYFCAIDGPTVHKDAFTVCGPQGFIAAERDLYSKGGCFVVGAMGCKDGIKGLGDTSDTSVYDFPSELTSYMDTECKRPEDVIKIGKDGFKSAFDDRWWLAKEPGDEVLIEDQIGFSYRDLSDKDNAAYGYAEDKFFLLETRYQQLERSGLASTGGSDWEEDPVDYQGKELYPWPGKINWEDNETMLRYDNPAAGSSDTFRLFNTDGHAQSQETHQAEYEEPKFEDWDRVEPSKGYKI